MKEKKIKEIICQRETFNAGDEGKERKRKQVKGNKRIVKERNVKETKVKANYKESKRENAIIE